jgi:hypothetical protein
MSKREWWYIVRSRKEANNMPGTKNWYCGIGLLDDEVVVYATAYGFQPGSRFKDFKEVEVPTRLIQTITGMAAANKFIVDAGIHPREVGTMYVSYGDGTIRHANLYDWIEDCGWTLRQQRRK